MVRIHTSTPGGNTHAINIFGLKIDTVPPSANDLALNAGMAFSPISHNMQTEFSQVLTEVVWNHGGVLEEGSDATIYPGSSGGLAAVVNTSVLIRKFTGLIGRDGRGRFYIPGQSMNGVNVDAATLTDTAITNWQVAANSFFSDLETSGTPLYLLHRNPLVLPTAVSNLVVEAELATQRRRLRKAAHR